MRAALFLTIASVAWAQEAPHREFEQEAKMIEDRFAAGTQADLAWAAHLAAKYRHPEFAPRIRELLSRSDWTLQTFALDALIRLNADVDDAVLEPLLKDPSSFSAALALAAQHRASHIDALMRLLRDSDQDLIHWMIVTSILSDAPRPPAFIREVLAGWVFEAEITVKDPHPPPARHTSVADCADSSGSMGHDYPPLPDDKTFEAGPLTEGVRLSRGPHPMVYGKPSCFAVESEVTDDDRVILTDSRFRSTWTLDHLRYIAGFSADPPPAITITFHKAGQYRRETEAYRKRIVAYVKDVCEALVEKGMIGRNEIIEPRIAIHVNDRRADQRKLLPEIAVALPEEVRP